MCESQFSMYNECTVFFGLYGAPDYKVHFDFWMLAVLFSYIRCKMPNYKQGSLICHTHLIH